MNREKTWDLLNRNLKDPATVNHCLAVEACMRSLAGRFGGDEELWGNSGLIHDMDLDLCKGNLEEHTLVAARILEEEGAPLEMIRAVLGHNDKAERTSEMDKALWVVDPTTGMITAAALIRPSKSTSDLTVKSIKKRMKDKRFAAAVSRDQIRACEKELGLQLDDFLALCLNAMNEIREEIGL